MPRKKLTFPELKRLASSPVARWSPFAFLGFVLVGYAQNCVAPPPSSSQVQDGHSSSEVISVSGPQSSRISPCDGAQGAAALSPIESQNWECRSTFTTGESEGEAIEFSEFARRYPSDHVLQLQYAEVEYQETSGGRGRLWAAADMRDTGVRARSCHFSWTYRPAYFFNPQIPLRYRLSDGRTWGGLHLAGDAQAFMSGAFSWQAVQPNSELWSDSDRIANSAWLQNALRTRENVSGTDLLRAWILPNGWIRIDRRESGDAIFSAPRITGQSRLFLKLPFKSYSS